MSKPIIAVSFSGIIMKDTPWKKAHEVWFEHYAKKLNKPEIEEYAKKENWFDYVDKVMALAEPELNDSERTIKAREKYFDVICDFGCDNLSLENKEVIEYFYSIKKEFFLGLITTTSLATIQRILKAIKHEDLFDFIECSLLEEKDDKLAVFKRFIEKNEKPILYLGGKRKETIDFCQENNIKFVFANFEKEKTEINSISSVNELKELISKL